ncbi:hypothetical protein [Scytonema sp. NUACC26]|uniref:hypothetical protein n=1 Tax=Scytonema sp. NUACC26 TaxID=3140176 RepID=UPI0034DC9D68
MLSRNIDLDVLRYLIDVIEVERHRNDIQDDRLCEQDNKISTYNIQINQINKKNEEIIHMIYEQEAQLQESQKTIDFLLSKVRQFEYLIFRNQQLEELANFYLQD